MAKKPSATLVVLREIRDEIRGLRERVDTVARRKAGGETRLATEVVGVAKAVTDIRDLLRYRRVIVSAGR